MKEKKLTKNTLFVISPLFITFLVLFYYALIGPLLAITQGCTVHHEVEHQSFLWKGWAACFCFFIFFAIGFLWKQKKVVHFTLAPEQGKRWRNTGLFMAGLSIALFSVYAGSGIWKFFLPMDTVGVKAVGYNGAFANYFVESMSLLPGAIGILIIAAFQKQISWVYVLLIALCTICLYVSIGFRFRIAILLITILVLFLLNKEFKTVLRTTLLLFPVVFILFGIVKLSRNRGQGLMMENLSSLVQSNTFINDFLCSGFGEASPFFATASIVHKMPTQENFVYFQPIVESLVSPIPRKLWQAKPTGNHLGSLIRLYYPNYTKEVPIEFYLAYLLPGSFYMCFGWFGLVIGAFLLGWICKFMFLTLLHNQQHPIIQVNYALFIAVLCFTLTRGYLPINFILFHFIVTPYLIVLYFYTQKIQLIPINDSLTSNESQALHFSKSYL